MMLKESTRRSVRTLVQMIVGAAAAIPAIVFILQQYIPPAEPDRPRIWGYVSGGCAALVVTATIVTKVWNMIEAKFNVGWLKQPPATPANPDPEGPA